MNLAAIWLYDNFSEVIKMTVSNHSAIVCHLQNIHWGQISGDFLSCIFWIGVDAGKLKEPSLLKSQNIKNCHQLSSHSEAFFANQRDQP